MRFSDITGNEEVKKALTGMVDSGRIPHAIMFHENDGGGAFSLCIAFLQYLFCQNKRESEPCGECSSCNKISKLIHPDVYFAFPVATKKSSPKEKATSLLYANEFRTLCLENPFFTEMQLNDALGIEGKSALITVNESKVIIDKVSFNSLEGGYKCILIYLPEKMNQEAANKLLKSLEEPSENTLFLLITHKPESVMQTISSRCLRIRVRPVRQNGAEEPDELFVELFHDLMEALISRDLLKSLEEGEKLAALDSREKEKAFCKFAEEQLRSLFLLQQGLDALCPGADAYIQSLKDRCKKTFPRAAAGCFDRTVLLIERNVNQKILFCDLVNRLFLAI